MKFLSIDFETANHDRNSACSVGLVLIENQSILRQKYFLIRPPTSQFLFTKVHGLEWDNVKNAKSFSELWPEISNWFDGIDFVVAHNAPFDKSVLEACLNHSNIPIPAINFRCSMKESKKKWNLESGKLSDICGLLGIPLVHHNALSDAVACAKVMIAVLK